jgi:general secretion pathway protein C
MTEKEDLPESPLGTPEPPKESPTQWKMKLDGLRSRFSQTLKKENLQRAVQNFDAQAFLERTSAAFQKRNASFYGTLATIVLSTYFIADVTSLLLGEWIPAPPQSRLGRYGNLGPRPKTLNDYNVIFSRNLFNSRGLIPGDEVTTGVDLSGPPVKSSLPLNLIGTLILSNELLSIATIEDKSTSQVSPVRVDDEIPDKAKILKIEPRRVIFINKASGRKEYIELPEDLIAMNPRITPGRPAAPSGPGVEKVAPTQYNVSRSEVDKALADFNRILTEARAVPNFENGVASGYKLFQIVPGSIYDKLGLQNGDVISGLNGNPVNDPGKAFEMLNELKTANHLELQVKKDGKSLNYIYDIH